MTGTINYDDWAAAFHAWEALDQLLNATTYPETLEAMQRITPDLRDRLLELVNKLRAPGSAPEEEEEEDLAVRELRFPRKGAYPNLVHIAAYRYMRDDEARMLSGGVKPPAIPYGVTWDPADIHVLIQQYRWAYTHTARGYGLPHKQYASLTIRRLVEFSPSDRELDEAAEYYRNNPE